MKLVSWNVNGLRACVSKGFMNYFNEADADIFCLQETKLQEGQIELDLGDAYEQYWNYAEKKGYSGTAVFTRIKPLSVRYGMEENREPEGRIITLEFEGFYLVNVYTPNAKRDLSRLAYRLEWEDRFRAYLRQLDEAKPVIVCGDMNVAHKEIDLKNAKSNEGNSGFTAEERGKMTEPAGRRFYRHLPLFLSGPRRGVQLVVLHAEGAGAEHRVANRLFPDLIPAGAVLAGCANRLSHYGQRSLPGRAGDGRNQGAAITALPHPSGSRCAAVCRDAVCSRHPGSGQRSSGISPARRHRNCELSPARQAGIRDRRAGGQKEDGRIAQGKLRPAGSPKIRPERHSQLASVSRMPGWLMPASAYLMLAPNERKAPTTFS